jgi:hypothetical protein
VVALACRIADVQNEDGFLNDAVENEVAVGSGDPLVHAVGIGKRANMRKGR